MIRGKLLAGGLFLVQRIRLIDPDHHTEAGSLSALHVPHRVIAHIGAVGFRRTDAAAGQVIDVRVRLAQAHLGGKDRGLEALGHAVSGHPIGDLRLRHGVGDDAKGIAPAVQLLDGGYGVRPGHPAAVMVAPQAGQLGGVGKNHIRIIFRQHVLGPQFSLGSIQQGGLGLLAVCLPALLQLGKQGVMALRGADQFHETGFRPVNKLLVRQDNAQSVSYIEENSLDIGGHGSSSFEIQGRGPTAGKRGDPRSVTPRESQTFAISVFIL